MIRGILGGSFDPVHSGHVAMAAYVLDRGLAQVLHVIPARLSPHKDATGASAEQRLAMVRLAFQDFPGVIIDPRELDRPGPSFTVDTLTEIEGRYPGDRLLLVIGQDNLAGLGTWKDPAGLGRLAEVAVLARKDEGPGGSDQTPELPAGLRIRFHEDFHQPVSSTQIRAILAQTGRRPEDLEQFLPGPVAAYIVRHQLYRA